MTKFYMLKCTPKPPIIFAHHHVTQPAPKQQISVDHHDDFEQFRKAEQEWEAMNQQWLLK